MQQLPKEPTVGGRCPPLPIRTSVLTITFFRPLTTLAPLYFLILLQNPIHSLINLAPKTFFQLNWNHSVWEGVAFSPSCCTCSCLPMHCLTLYLYLHL